MTLSESTFAYFVSCPPGLEVVLQDDLRALGVATRTTAGGVEGRGVLQVLYTILHGSRVAESLRVRLKSFRATDFGTLQHALARLPWHAYLNSAADVDISVTCHKSRLYHSDAVRERVATAIERAFNKEQSPAVKVSAAPAVPARIFVRLDHDVVQVSVDASGERLHRRGYRTHVVDAPLRETLAAAIVRLAGAQSEPARVWDPFCGSGTLALEWLALRLGVAARRETYALDNWPICKGEDRAELSAGQVHAPAEQAADPRAWLTDTNPRAIAAARHNAEAAGLLSRCEFQHCDFEQAARAVPSGTLVLANPPYGVRLDTQAAATKLIARFERLLVSRPDLRPALMVCPEGLLRGVRQIPWKPVARFPNGGVNVTVFRVDT